MDKTYEWMNFCRLFLGMLWLNILVVSYQLAHDV